MKIIFFSLFILLSNISCAQRNADSLLVGFWNLENLFDTTDDPLKEDEEFLPGGEREWTEERYDRKLYNIARVIRSMNNGDGPDILGVCEIENKGVLDSLIARYLSDKNYMIAHLESPDGRGIDNGLIYKSDFLQILEVFGDTVDLPSPQKTRLIFGAKFLFNKSDTLYFFVNHWPSRRGGQMESEQNRIESAKTLRARLNLILKNNPSSNIIITGDFNDEPNDVSVLNYLKAEPFMCDSILDESFSPDNETDLFNLSYVLWNEGVGSYKYQDDWNMIDQIIVSRNLIIGNQLTYECESYEVYKPAFMVTKTGKFKGTPFPTFGGRRYLGGYSDHFPILAKFKMIGKINE